MTENGRQEDTHSGIIGREIRGVLSRNRTSLRQPAPMRAILRLRAVRDLSARIMVFGIWSVHVDR